LPQRKGTQEKAGMWERSSKEIGERVREKDLKTTEKKKIKNKEITKHKPKRRPRTVGGIVRENGGRKGKSKRVGDAVPRRNPGLQERFPLPCLEEYRPTDSSCKSFERRMRGRERTTRVTLHTSHNSKISHQAE